MYLYDAAPRMAGHAAPNGLKPVITPQAAFDARFYTRLCAANRHFDALN